MGGIDTATAAVPVTAAAHHIAVPLEERWEQNLGASGGNKWEQNTARRKTCWEVGENNWSPSQEEVILAEYMDLPNIC